MYTLVSACTCMYMYMYMYVAHLEGHVVIFPSHASFLDIASVKHTGIIIAHKLLYCTCTYMYIYVAKLIHVHVCLLLATRELQWHYYYI